MSCYWYEQNKCTLEYLPCDIVEFTLGRSPQARIDLLNCQTQGLCPNVDSCYIDYADTYPLITDAVQENEKWQKWVNTYIDNYRGNHWGNNK